MQLLSALAPILVALIGIIPTILSSSNKTQKSIENLQKETKTSIDSVEKKLDAHIKDDEWSQAKQRRVRILRFNDELCAGMNHSENHYEEILEDIDEYEKFCAKHPDYKNNKGRLAMDNIEKEYQRRKTNNDFLC